MNFVKGETEPFQDTFPIPNEKIRLFSGGIEKQNLACKRLTKIKTKKGKIFFREMFYFLTVAFESFTKLTQ